MSDPRRIVGATICHVLSEDVDLAEAVPAAARGRAIEECIAAAVRIPQGPWSGHFGDTMPDGIGLLVLGGLLIRQVRIGGAFGAEILGERDLLRPWQGEDARPALRRTSSWQALQVCRVAVLDRAAAGRFARYPELTGRLVARALERSRNLAMNMAIVQQARIDIRVHMVLWHLADRWGHMTPEGAVLPLPLTHDVLAHLVAARRPTVSTVLAHLAKDDLVHRREDGWVLRGDPPGEILELQAAHVGPGRLLRASEAAGRVSGG